MSDVTLLRQLQPDEVVCPAGTLVGDANVRCGIEQNTLIGYEDPHSIEAFCCGEYQSCSTWQAAKKVEAHGGDLGKVLEQMATAAARHRSTSALREARLRMAQRLMVDRSPEGRAFRQRLKIGEFAPVKGK